MAQAQPTTITPKALAKRLTETPKEVFVVDVRTQAEFDQGHIPGAIHIPIDSIQSGQGLRQIQTQIQGRQLVTYCYSGVRSRLVLNQLIPLGIQGLDLEGGIVEWRNQIDPKMAEP
ncbi:MAG: rhodanese-like domain-containing protein [Alkalinema sp. RU_4_3]|nr:rhodanese-like domain-containing protein [Alkalinema sp. RU_4_3]